jgi:hypothetical protein
MNKINPLYIFIFSVVLFLLSTISIISSSSSLQFKKEDINKYIIVANRYNNLQKSWGKNSGAKNTINKILKSSNIQNASINKTSNTIKIYIKNTSIDILDKFINKVLNEHLIIKKFTLTKNELQIEVGI